MNHVRIRPRERFDLRRRVRAKDQQRAVRWIAERAGKLQKAAGVRLVQVDEMDLAHRQASLGKVLHDVVNQRKVFHLIP